MNISDSKFWESAGLIVIVAVFIVGAGIATFQIGKLSLDKISDRTVASVEKALENSKIELSNQMKDRQKELLKMPAYEAPFLGEEDAHVEVEGFFDFACPYTKVFFDDFPLHAKKNLLKGGDVKLYFRNFPVLNEDSQVLALSATCAGEQGKFWQMSELLLTNQDEIRRDIGAVTNYANSINLDMDLYDYCIENKKYMDHILQDSARAEQFNIKKMPAFVIDGQLVREGIPTDGDVERWKR
ncbi:hypothetical protein D4R87_01890 [bacterium]|nr:MAG: hypothetical protein D4R87_01890 [bacterium]